MKLSIISLLLAALAQQCLAGTSAPEISIGLNTATAGTSKLGGIEPQIKWKTSGSIGDNDVFGGIDVTVQDVDAFKETVWGMVKRNVKGFGLSARGQFSVTNIDKVDLDFQCDTPTDTVLQMKASAGKDGSFSVSKVKAVQTIDAAGGTVIAAPTYDLGSSKGDLSLAYAKDNTNSIQLDINTDNDAKLSLMQRLGSNHIVRPSITKDGQLEVKYETRVEIGTITTTYKPNHHIDIQFADGPWQANLNAPMDGYLGLDGGCKVSVKTKVDINPDMW
ncbi:expressed unknown protein [Seminavis robusta]|uniref:Uncharacterized protein n=1 Tax=Seminavis robusta TaxID=568900 RepID=A0A9N8DE27_9STRA|nr:expressed unknown protein [Seminavis robusta]|eukprot:Sro29_g019320.1 n/a (276) ;mRNA; f:153137-154238